MTFAGLKKCRPTTSCGRCGHLAIASMSSVDVLRREDAAGLGDGIELAKDVLLQIEILEDGFDDQIGRGHAVVGQRRGDAAEAFAGLLPGSTVRA